MDREVWPSAVHGIPTSWTWLNDWTELIVNCLPIHFLMDIWWFPVFTHANKIAATAKSLQSCPTLCDPIDGSPPGSPIPGILQARILEWVAMSFSNVWKWKVKVKLLSCIRLLATPWTAAYQAPPSMGFSRQEYWSGVPLPSPIKLLWTFIYKPLLWTYYFIFLKRSLGVNRRIVWQLHI